MEKLEGIFGIMWATLFLLSFAKYEAMRLDNHQWITEGEKKFSFLFRLFFILAASGSNAILAVSYAFLFAGLYDLFLNWLRKDVTSLWHLGSNSKWDRFFLDRMGMYKAVRISFPIIAIGLYILSFFYSNLFINL